MSSDATKELSSKHPALIQPKASNVLKENLRQMSSLNVASKPVVDCESKSLIQKAHELYNHKNVASSEQNLQRLSSKNTTPDKPIISLADRAARINQELPQIEELADKENDTFAVGGPLKALRVARNLSVKKLEQNEKERSQLRSAEVSKNKYRMYREPGENDSVGVGKLARGQLPPRSRLSLAQKDDIHETNTPAALSSKALDLKGPGIKLPRIQSSRQSQVNTPLNRLSRQQSRQSNEQRNIDYISQARANYLPGSQRNIDMISLSDIVQLSPRSQQQKQIDGKARPRSIQRPQY